MIYGFMWGSVYLYFLWRGRVRLNLSNDESKILGALDT